MRLLPAAITALLMHFNAPSALSMGAFPGGDYVPESDQLAKPTISKKRSKTPDTPLQTACLASPDLDCIKAVSAELAQKGGRTNKAAYAAVVARIDGMDAAAELVRSNSDDPIIQHQQIALIASYVGDIEQAKEHLPLGWPDPASNSTEDEEKFTVIHRIVQDAVANQQSPRSIMRFVSKHWEFDQETATYDMAERQRIALMNLFALLQQSRGATTGIKMLEPGSRWSYPPSEKTLNELKWIAVSDLSEPAATLDAHAGKFQSGSHDRVRYGIVARLLVSGDGEKAAELAALIEDPFLRLFSQMAIADSKTTDMSDTRRLQVLEVADLDVPTIQVNDGLLLRYHLLREIRSGTGPLPETDMVLKAFVTNPKAKRLPQAAFLLARAGRLQDALRVAFKAPNRSIAIYNLVMGMSVPQG